ncbi:MAG TPA: ferritin-like domain-containing protein [Pseudoxanthomonas sp.]|nr:ferritin-like domain-containing protein [Pseudoxanthomonas sp.]
MRSVLSKSDVPPGDGDTGQPSSLFEAARRCLDAASVDDKVGLTQAYASEFAAGGLVIPDDAPPPQPIAMPGRPSRPALVHPRELPRRGLGSQAGRAAFIHAIAHIELNAIDLAWDAVYRFRGLPNAFYADWVAVANDESRHFMLLRERLRDFGFDYGDFDAHNGLWEMTEKTAHDGLARMALVPRVLEARGLDVTPGMIVKLRALGDDATADILEIILREEVAHVAAGSRWFRWYCEHAGIEPRARFRELLKEYAGGYLHGPFNVEARLLAGFDEDEMAALSQLAPATS